jgi:hypothetical protein
MIEAGFAQQLTFVAAQRRQAEDAIVAEALGEGIQMLYRETLIEAYLLNHIPRETVLQELGSDQLAGIEYQRTALEHDVAWGLKHD